MTVSETNEREHTTGGILGRAVGKAKEVLGQTTDNDDLAREGRLQQAQSDADREASRAQRQADEQEQRAAVKERQAETERERRELENQISAEEREEQIERDRL